MSSVVRPLAPDASADVIRRQQLDTALLVGQVVSNLREAVQARQQSAGDVPRKIKSRFDAEELEKELAALEARLEECRANLALTPKSRDGKLRFLKLGEKRAAALQAALERLQQQR